ncbi:hypothetical protein ABK040_003043 [Willaertia magna]
MSQNQPSATTGYKNNQLKHSSISSVDSGVVGVGKNDNNSCTSLDITFNNSFDEVPFVFVGPITKETNRKP